MYIVTHTHTHTHTQACAHTHTHIHTHTHSLSLSYGSFSLVTSSYGVHTHTHTHHFSDSNPSIVFFLQTILLSSISGTSLLLVVKTSLSSFLKNFIFFTTITKSSIRMTTCTPVNDPFFLVTLTTRSCKPGRTSLHTWVTYLKNEVPMRDRAFPVSLECSLSHLPLGGGQGGDRHLHLAKDIILFCHREEYMITLVLHRTENTQWSTCQKCGWNRTCRFHGDNQLFSFAVFFFFFFFRNALNITSDCHKQSLVVSTAFLY